MVSFKKCVCESKDNFMVYVISDNDRITFYYIHIDCESVIKESELKLSKNIEENEPILEKLKCTKNPKGAIFDIFVNSSFKKAYHLRENFKDYCISAEIPYQFINMNILIISSILHGIGTDIIKKDVQKITVLHSTQKRTNITDMIKNGDIWKIKNDHILSSINENFDFSKYNQCDKLVLAFDDLAQRKLYQNSKNLEKAIILNGSYPDYILPSLIKMVKDISDNETNKFKIVPNFISNCLLSIQKKTRPFFGNFYLNQWNGNQLPFTEIFVANVSSDEQICVNALSNCGKFYECLKVYEFPIFGIIRIKLIIDIHGFYEIKFEPIDALLSPCLNNQNNGMVTIVLSDLFIGIQIHTIKEIKDSSGDCFILPYISFFNEKLVIGKNAKEISKKEPTFVIYDLFKIIGYIFVGSDPPNPEWKFLIQKYSDGIFYVIFDTWRGKRKATPQFLMAILIDHLLKLARTYIGFKPKNIKITINNNNNSANPEIFNKIVSLACKILDVNCTF